MVELRAIGRKYKDIMDIIEEEFWEWISLGTISNICNHIDDEVVDTAVEESMNKELKKRVESSWWRLYNKKVKEALNYHSTIEEVAELFSSILDEYTFPVYKTGNPNPYEWQDPYTLYVFCWDFHYWRTSEELRKHWLDLCTDISAFWANYVHLFFMWDLIESPRVTWMHDAQVREMEYLWIDQALWCVDMIAEWLAMIDNWEEIFIHWVTGNHERMSAKRDWDPDRIVGCMMFELLKKQFPYIHFDYKADWVLIVDDGDNHFILAHWDNGFNSKKDMQILSALWVAGRKNIIASWHWHTGSLVEWVWYHRIKVPSLNENSESERNKFIAKALPWYVMMVSYRGKTHFTFVNV